MAKGKKITHDILRENEAFRQYLIRKHERLTILLDRNLENRKDPTDTDILLLSEEYDAYDKTSLPWNIQHDRLDVKNPKQMTLTDKLP